MHETACFQQIESGQWSAAILPLKVEGLKMFKGLSITKCERITAGMMTLLLDGGYTEVDFTGFAWRCDGCGLVWTRQHQAVNCAKRGHVSSYESEVYGVRRVENGRLIGDLHTYTRSAIRRDPVESKAAA